MLNFLKELEKPIEETLIGEALKGARELVEGQTYTFDLGTARNYEPIDEFRETTKLTVTQITGTAYMKLNSPSSTPHDLQKVQAFTEPDGIKRIYIYNTAQSGKTLVLKSGLLEKSVVDMELDIELMQADIAAVKGDIAGVKTAIESVNAKVAEQTTLGLVKTAIESVNAKVATATKQDLQATAAKQADIYARTGKTVSVTPSNNVLISNDSASSTEDHDYALRKEIQCLIYARFRVKFSIARYSGGGVGYGRIYKNGIALGDEQITTSNYPTYEEFAEDLAFEPNDLIQIYTKCPLTEFSTTYLKDFRLCGDEIVADGVVTLE